MSHRLPDRLSQYMREIEQCRKDGRNAQATALRAEVDDLLTLINELGLTGMAPSWEAGEK